jgi:peptidoglycan-associated lipoprotein
MKKWNILQVMLMVMAAVFLAAGCAKTPADTTAMEAPPVVSEVPQQEVSGIGAGGVTETRIGEQAMGDQAAAGQDEVSVSGLERIFFDFDQYVLTEQARATLAGNAAYLKANPGAQVRIEGHCDERGSDEYNLALGERRALAAKNYLESLGISASRLSVISYGEEIPLDPAHDESAWSKNRRAEFKVLR